MELNKYFDGMWLVLICIVKKSIVTSINLQNVVDSLVKESLEFKELMSEETEMGQMTAIDFVLQPFQYEKVSCQCTRE